MAQENYLEGKEVLVVDDELDVLDTLEELLNMNNCIVSRASSFEEAKVLLERQHFDFAVLDIMGVNGFELLDIANEKKIMAIMLTAHALSPETTIKSYKRGAAYFVPKEKMVNISDFLNEVAEAARNGENYWATWLDKLSGFYNKKFGSGWKEKDREFWEALANQDWKLAAVLREEEEE